MEELDWNLLPQSTWPIQDSLRFEAFDTVSALRRHLKLVQEMERASQQQIEDLQKKWEAAPNTFASAHGYEPVLDARVWGEEILRGTFGLLSVAITARVEAWLFDLCDNRGLECRTKKGKTNIDCARNNLKEAGIEIEELQGYESYDRARLLNNRLKHDAGIAVEEFSRRYGVQAGEAIRYEEEDWQALIDDVSEFLEKLCERFRETATAD